MTNDINRMAQEAYATAPVQEFSPMTKEALERFAALVAEKEREACAKVCDEAAAVLCPEGKRVNQVDTHIACVLRSKAAEIRARGQA